MTGVEMVLLARAVEACEDFRHQIMRADGSQAVRATWDGDWYVRPTLADALQALLRDLGEPVPEAPSAGAMDMAIALMEHADAATIAELASMWTREPETVLALLEGGAS